VRVGTRINKRNQLPETHSSIVIFSELNRRKKINLFTKTYLNNCRRCGFSSLAGQCAVSLWKEILYDNNGNEVNYFLKQNAYGKRQRE
jgi:hypothetical protein